MKASIFCPLPESPVPVGKETEFPWSIIPSWLIAHSNSPFLSIFHISSFLILVIFFLTSSHVFLTAQLWKVLKYLTNVYTHYIIREDAGGFCGFPGCTYSSTALTSFPSTSFTVGAWPDLYQKSHGSARADLLEHHQGTSQASGRNECK